MIPAIVKSTQQLLYTKVMKKLVRPFMAPRTYAIGASGGFRHVDHERNQFAHNCKMVIGLLHLSNSPFVKDLMANRIEFSNVDAQPFELFAISTALTERRGYCFDDKTDAKSALAGSSGISFRLFMLTHAMSSGVGQDSSTRI